MYVLPFAAAAAQNVAVSGGKGANLAKLTAKGFPVPRGIILCSQSYAEFIAPVASQLAAHVAEFDYENTYRLEKQTADVQSWLGKQPFPAHIETELACQLEDLRASGVTHVSVRSSATAEDTAAAAFAGQHETYLNVPVELAEVQQFIIGCWVSLWSARAVAYRRQVGVGVLDTAMAVVIQRMVQADVAGVAFSVDPIAGDLNTIVVDANYGLGESVVGGEFEVDHYKLDKRTGQLKAGHIAQKRTKIISLVQGGTEETMLGAQDIEMPCLSESQLTDLAALTRNVESAYGFPQDLEFAYAGPQLYLLQARPITAIGPRWTRDESAERFPNPVTPLAWDLAEGGFHQSLNHSFELMGLPPFKGKWFAMFGGYIYGDQNAVQLYADGVPLRIRSLDELRGILPVIREKYGWVQELPMHWSRDLDWYLLKLGELHNRNLQGLSLAELWAHIQEINTTGSRYFLPNIAISITQRVLYKVLHGMLQLVVGPQEAAGMFDALLAHCETKTGTINVQLFHLAHMMQKAREAGVDVTTLTVVEAKTLLPDFAQAFDRLLAEHGHRETDFDPYVPTWAEAPHVVFDTLCVMTKSTLRHPRDNERQLKMRAQETLFTLQKRVPEDLRYFVTEIVRLAQAYTSLDDLEHYQTTRLTLPLRRALKALGSQLVQLGIVAEPFDVFFARQDTLCRAIKEPSVMGWTALAQEIENNKAAYAIARESTPQWILGEDDADAVDMAGGMKGIPGSPGKACGPVFIVRSTDDFGQFPKDAVLVARTTNPAWTPLFYSACAVITESGGPLSHGAVTAREMQKPAVMAIRNILTQVKNGDWVEVDGAKGTVRLAKPPHN